MAAVVRDRVAEGIKLAAQTFTSAVLAQPELVVLEGTLRCRDCDLREQHGERTLCDRHGHRGALLTADGRLWNIVDQEVSAALVHDSTLLGRQVRVRAWLYRQSGSLTVESFEILG